VRLVGFDIHQIIHQMNMMIGVIEVKNNFIEIQNDIVFDIFKGYAVAIGNFNHDDNQGRRNEIFSPF
jgi:hypothetical protein